MAKDANSVKHPRREAFERRAREEASRLGGWYQTEVGAFYWTVPAPDIVNSGREEQGLISV
jgi:hypothetical protein